MGKKTERKKFRKEKYEGRKMSRPKSQYKKTNVDVWTNICRYLNYNDIKSLKRVDIFMENMIQQIMPSMITREMKKISQKKEIVWIHVENIIHNTLVNMNKKMYIVSKIKTVNEIYEKLLKEYITYGTLYRYENKEDIFDLYILLGICIYKNTYNLDYKIEYLETMNETEETKKIKYNYYKFILKKGKLINLKVLNKISKTCVTEREVYRLFGIYTLDLSKTKLIKSKNKEIKKIVDMKFLNNRSVFYSNNYIEIKNFLKREDREKWVLMLKWEITKIWTCTKEMNEYIKNEDIENTEKTVIDKLNNKMRIKYFS